MQDDSDGDETFFKRIDFEDDIATNKSLKRIPSKGAYRHNERHVRG